MLPMKNGPESTALAPPSRGRWFALGPGVAGLAACFVGRVPLERPDLPARLALAPLPLFVFFLAAFVRLVRGMDELERRIPLEVLALAGPAVLVRRTLGLLRPSRTAVSPADGGLRHVWPIGVAGMAVSARRDGFR